MTSFQYHPDILNRYPDIVCGAIYMSKMVNGPTSELLQTTYQAEQEAVLNRIGDTPLSELESLAAWRSAFRAFGVNPTKYRSAVEALLRRLTKKGDIPSINAIVDICNMVSIRYTLPVAAFDIRHLHPPITVQFADGKETFTPLFANESENPDPGEVIFADEEDLVVARRWCWRQSDESATRPDTTEAIFTIEAHHPGGKADVKSALDDLETLLTQFIGGEGETGIINADRLSF
jgi:DNA/RNA-binding domain of Phe-tRNA-synthetase-like protein